MKDKILFLSTILLTCLNAAEVTSSTTQTLSEAVQALVIEEMIARDDNVLVEEALDRRAFLTEFKAEKEAIENPTAFQQVSNIISKVLKPSFVGCLIATFVYSAPALATFSIIEGVPLLLPLLIAKPTGFIGAAAWTLGQYDIIATAIHYAYWPSIASGFGLGYYLGSQAYDLAAAVTTYTARTVYSLAASVAHSINEQTNGIFSRAYSFAQGIYSDGQSILSGLSGVSEISEEKPRQGIFSGLYNRVLTWGSLFG